MAQIVRITEEKVMIGTDDGGIIEARREDINFDPVVGDEVNVFTNETTTVISKTVKFQKTTEPDSGSGININIVNENASRNVGADQSTGKQKVVNKLAYILLALFLGGLGAHKFYSGRIGLGILYLVFCWTWIPSFVSLIEGIVAIFKKADANGAILV